MKEGTQQTITPRQFQTDVLSPEALKATARQYEKTVEALYRANQRTAQAEGQRDALEQIVRAKDEQIAALESRLVTANNYIAVLKQELASK